MPLPFLTVDREPAADHDLPSLKHEDREMWRRPYRPGPWRVGGGALLLLLASYMLFSALVIAVAGSYPSALVCAFAAALVIAAALRLLRAGVWVSAHGIRHVGVVRTSTLRWREVDSVQTVQQPVRWLGLPRTVQGEALRLTPARNGRRQAGAVREDRILLTDHNADFLTRHDSFDSAADVIEAWAAEYRR
ncbi:hypothetical protein [Streptomyces sulphureus]|uniref:hypothetical protein n=1 Tax=Streptomyces sulphureus TaxID=47758 RepID=UPI000378191A|nr:hypothetical protein [Streptomyces sulphureus]